MNLARMMTDKVFFEDKNGSRSGPYKTKFGTDRITVFQDELNVSEGDRVIHLLPSGTEHIYVAEAVHYSAAARNIPGHFRIAITKEIASTASKTSAAAVGTGDNDNENATALLQSLAAGIENTGFPAEQKDEAKRLLRALVAHPVVAAVLNTVKAGAEP